MRPRVEIPQLGPIMTGAEDEIAESVTAAMAEAGDGLLQDAREDVRRSGLGVRLANTWRLNLYPGKGEKSLDPAAYLFSKAPKLIDAYMRGAVIVPVNGQRRLAIPTANTPSKGRGRKMTPLDVETAFNQDLILVPSKKSDAILAFVDVALGRFWKSQGRAYGKKKQVRAGKPKLVLMFVLVRQVSVRSRLEAVETVAQRWADRLPDLITDRWR